MGDLPQMYYWGSLQNNPNPRCFCRLIFTCEVGWNLAFTEFFFFSFRGGGAVVITESKQRNVPGGVIPMIVINRVITYNPYKLAENKWVTGVITCYNPTYRSYKPIYNWKGAHLVPYATHWTVGSGVRNHPGRCAECMDSLPTS